MLFTCVQIDPGNSLRLRLHEIGGRGRLVRVDVVIAWPPACPMLGVCPFLIVDAALKLTDPNASSGNTTTVGQRNRVSDQRSDRACGPPWQAALILGQPDLGA